MSKAVCETQEVLIDKSYKIIRQSIIDGQTKMIKQVNQTLISVYHKIGKEVNDIIECRGSKVSEEIVKNISSRLTKEFGKGFTKTNLYYMRSFYLTFPNFHAVSGKLSWTHYRLLIKVKNKEIREFYIEEYSKSNWSTRQLERQINSMYYQRLLASKNKDDVRSEIHLLEPKEEYEKIIKDPYILEFLDLDHSSKYYEKDLETSLINNLHKFY